MHDPGVFMIKIQGAAGDMLRAGMKYRDIALVVREIYEASMWDEHLRRRAIDMENVPKLRDEHEIEKFLEMHHGPIV